MHTHPTPADGAVSVVLAAQGKESTRTFRIMYVPPLAVRRTNNRRQVVVGLSMEAALIKAEELNATVPNRGHFGCPFFEVAPDLKRKTTSIKS